MKLTDIYFEYKKKYENYIILCRMGNFYNVFGDDSKIIYLLNNYKITIDNNIEKVGFPIVALEKILKKLKEDKINYIVIEKTEGLINITIKKRFTDNTYEYFLRRCEGFYEYKTRIEGIYSSLNKKIYDADLAKIINKIEELL